MTYHLFSTSSNEDYIAENCLKRYFPATSMESGVFLNRKQFEKQLKTLYSYLTRLDKIFRLQMLTNSVQLLHMYRVFQKMN